MKKIILLLCLFILFVSLEAQVSKEKTYYAIDGSEWVNKYDRDKKERLLWDQIDLNLQLALKSGKLGDEDGKTRFNQLKILFETCKNSFSRLRLADSGKDLLQSGEFRFFLSKNGVSARLSKARNNEPFNMEEYGNCFNSVLREYNFNSDIVKELAEGGGDEYNLDFVVSDFTERMSIVTEEIDSEMKNAEFKEKEIAVLIPKYKAAQDAVRKKQKQQEQQKRQQK